MRRLACLLTCVLTLACGRQRAQPATATGLAEPVTPGSCPPQAPGSGPQHVDQMREAILSWLAVQPGWTVADIGVGGGWFTQRVARAAGPRGHVYGTDVDARAIEQLRASPHDPALDAPIDAIGLQGQRDTGLDALPADHLDLLLMIDSLCFPKDAKQDDNILYLKRFLRVLKPGARLVHHMDCTCPTTLDATEKLFRAAGFVVAPRVDVLGCAQLAVDACPSAAMQERARYLGVFQKP